MRNRLLKIPDAFLRATNGLFHSRPENLQAVNPARDDEFLNKVVERSVSKVTDISSHLKKIYLETLQFAPELVVELGVRSGESTVALNMAAQHIKAKHVSVDIDDCSGVISDPDWTFIHEDDIELSKRFPQWLSENNLKASIDVLFIDTSHEYHHTLQELVAWLPLLSDRAMVILHDTYSPKIVRMPNGSFYPKVNRFPQDDVRNAFDKFFSVNLPWEKPFTTKVGEWYVEHDPTSFGLTFMKKFNFQ